ncbi:MAG: plastocyanin/azurin family copper-binding protein [Bacteroidota bacterium]
MKRVSIILVFTALLAACGTKNTTTDKAAEAKSYEFTVNAVGNTMADMTYDTREIKVMAGSKVVLNLVNQGTDGAMLHNLVIVKQGTEKEVAMEGLNYKETNYFNPQNTNIIAGTAIANPGASVKLEFTAPEAGTYTYICTYPGHWMKMQGVLLVE